MDPDLLESPLSPGDGCMTSTPNIMYSLLLLRNWGITFVILYILSLWIFCLKLKMITNREIEVTPSPLVRVENWCHSICNLFWGKYSKCTALACGFLLDLEKFFVHLLFAWLCHTLRHHRFLLALNFEIKVILKCFVFSVKATIEWTIW